MGRFMKLSTADKADRVRELHLAHQKSAEEIAKLVGADVSEIEFLIEHVVLPAAATHRQARDQPRRGLIGDRVVDLDDLFAHGRAIYDAVIEQGGAHTYTQNVKYPGITVAARRVGIEHAVLRQVLDRDYQHPVRSKQIVRLLETKVEDVLWSPDPTILSHLIADMRAGRRCLDRPPEKESFLYGRVLFEQYGATRQQIAHTLRLNWAYAGKIIEASQTKAPMPKPKKKENP